MPKTKENKRKKLKYSPPEMEDCTSDLLSRGGIISIVAGIEN